MLFTMWLNLYATRLVLANLGVEDLGVYGVVGSIVGLIAVFTGGITNAVQRFITFELGRKEGCPNKVFSSSLNVLFVVSIIAFILLEVGGLWMLYNKVDIPKRSMDAAFWVYQWSVLTCIVNVISIPYNALIIAHEKMGAFAGISILQVILTFLSAYCLTYFDNRLLVYGVFMAIVSIFIRIIYQIYCHREFQESRYHFIIDIPLMKQIGKFTGVSTFSGGLQTLSSSGIVFVINLTFGVAINAVYTISLQLKNAILSFSLNIFKAISPQITKTYANGNIVMHKKLVYGGAKLEVFMIYFILIPMLFKTKYIMELWLGDVPPYAIEFAQCTVFIGLTHAIYEPIRTSVLATNNIAKFLIYPELFYLLVLPFGYYVSKITNSPLCLILLVVFMDFIMCSFGIMYAVKVAPIKISEIFKYVLKPCLIVGIVDCCVVYCTKMFVSENICGLLLLFISNSLFLLVVIFCWGLDINERIIITNSLKKCKFRNH